MHVIVFSGGECTKSTLVEDALQSAQFFIAADSGAHLAKKLGIHPDAIVGDFDSLSHSEKTYFEKKGMVTLSHPTEKDETDTELAIDYAVQKGATDITILGGNRGNRFDHVIANLLLSLTYSVPIRFMDGKQISWVVKGPQKVKIEGKKGELLSLIPLLGNVEGIMSKNLYYPLKNDTLVFGKPRGVSNVLTKNIAKIAFEKGSLLLVHTIGS